MKIRCFDCFIEYECLENSGVCPICGCSQEDNGRKSGDNSLPEGTVLNNRYIIGKKSGQGGFGITYKSWDSQLEQIVAVKEYYPSGLVNRVPGTTGILLSSSNDKKRRDYQNGLERYISEARMMARYLSHENIVNVYGFFEENNTAYIVMEYMDGIGLDKYLKQCDDRILDYDTAVDITLAVCNALNTIHNDGIVHRDISPDNIFICTNGKYKLFDFGAARLSGEENSMLTIILKPGYAPPEQYSNLSMQGPWTDIYALGASLYKMLTGKMPEESMNRKIRDELIPPIKLNPDIPEYINDIVMKAMALEPELRFNNISEFENVLRKELKVEAPETFLKKKRKINKLKTGIAAAAVYVCSIIIAGKMTSSPAVKQAEITVWYIDSGNTGEIIQEIGSDFKNIYKNISVSYRGFDEDSYIQEIEKAREKDDMPDIYQSDNLDMDNFETASLKPVIRDIGNDECYFIKENSDYIIENEKLPLGFNIPVCYLNTVKNEYSGERITELGDVVSANKLISVNDNLKSVFEKIEFIDINSRTETSLDFISGKTDILLSDTSEFYKVQQALPARAKMLLIDNRKVVCSFADCWSINCNDNYNQLKASEEFLKFLLGSVSQDYMYIRNAGNALPLNTKAFSEYSKVHSEFNDILSVVKIDELIYE